MDREQLAQWLREALAHLYDHVFLQLHPLAHSLKTDSTAGMRGADLHRLLLEAIESLRPAPAIPVTDPAWRPYLALYLRYVEGMDVGPVAQEISISPRQLRREHAKGVEALADQIGRQYFAAQPSAHLKPRRTGDHAQADALNSEIMRLGSTGDPIHAGTSLGGTVRSVLATLDDLATSQHVTFAVNLADDLSPVWMERVVLRQILLNVLSHFLARSRDGAIALDAAPADRQISLVIRHCTQNRGMEPGQVQGDRLAVAERLVQMQSGQMCVEQKDREHSSELKVELILPARHPPTVLIIDDSPDLIRLFQRYLSGSAYRSVGATSSQEALHLAQELQPQVIVLDVMMPDQDGWELLQVLKNQPATAEVPVIVCSVLRERSLALSLGAADFIEKPVTQHALLAALAAYGSRQEHAGHPGSL